jgi:hypothetical protein
MQLACRGLACTGLSRGACCWHLNLHTQSKLNTVKEGKLLNRGLSTIQFELALPLCQCSSSPVTSHSILCDSGGQKRIYTPYTTVYLISL